MTIIKKIKKLLNKKDIVIEVDSEKTITFCFLGEFGYELISWIPYLIFLKEKLSFKMTTISRPGSTPYYYFSDKHIEIESDYLTNSWGDYKNYKKVAKKENLKEMVFPSNIDTEKQRISIGSIEWEVKNIHSTIQTNNYRKVDLNHINIELPFLKDKKIVVINNKYNMEWGEAPINYFTKEDLINLRDLLISRGYFVVYNTFYERTKDDVYLQLEDDEIFNTEDCFDMRKHYNICSNQSHKNISQISLYNKAEFIIGVQGGNIYTPAICNKRIIMLMKKGDYIDYKELSKIYNVDIDVFYETEHILAFIKSQIPKV